MSVNQTPAPAANMVRQLSQLIQQAEHAGQRFQRSSVSTGCPALDQLLGGEGLLRGSLVEWLGDGPGSGASVLALVAAREACRDAGALLVVDRAGTFYPPAAAAWQIDLHNTILVQPRNEKDEHWAIDQALRCEHVAAVAAWPRRLDDATFRRLQLAAETSGCLGLFVRPATARGEPSWADARLQVFPRPAQEGWRLDVQLLRFRNRLGEGGQIELQVNERTGEIHEAHPSNLAPPLARAAVSEHSA